MNALWRLGFLMLAIAFSAAGSEVGDDDIVLRYDVERVEQFVDESGAVQRRFATAERVLPGDELKYTIWFSNTSERAIDAGSIVITNAVPETTEYLAGTADGPGTEIVFSVDDGESFADIDELTVGTPGREEPADPADYTTIRWIYQPALEPGREASVSFQVRLK